ncbi:MAG: glycoside hydrolase family protein [Thiovulaceae bacterium]|nr:glycoside hydrolase family protein [Sulfurimonadaceae bacterium]
MNEVLESIKKNEGFKGVVYKDTLGFDTIGYGTKLPLTQEEAQLILVSRMGAKASELKSVQPVFETLPVNKQGIIIEMCYQMGVNGVMNFKNMWFALQKKDYATASKEMLNSKWAKQTPNRANQLALLMAS